MESRNLVAVAVVFVGAHVASFARAAEPDEVWSYGGPHCGVASACAALNAIGKPVEFARLLDTKYIASAEGSTLAELRQAVRDSGAEATAFYGLSLSGLRSLRSPAILHVATASRPRRYKHWVTYLGTQGGMARLLAAPRPVELVSFSDLLAQWDGIALVVSREPTSALRLRSHGWADAAVRLLMAGAAIGAVALIGRRHAPRRVRPLVLLSVTCGLALLVDLISPTGVLRNRFAVASITASHTAADFPDLPTETIGQLARDGAVMIDARDDRSFRLGHIPGAISVPFDLPLGKKRQVLSEIDRRTPIVVYCQSEGCPYADELATELSLNGYSNLSLYRGGWVEWRRAHGE